MRRDVSSDFIKKLDVEKLSKLTYIPENRIIGAIERKTLQYVHAKPELFRFDKPISNIEAGTSVFLEPFDIVRGFPKISRILMLHPGVAKHFSTIKTVLVEEKMNGYNVRVALIGDRILGITRGGYVCPYTTDKINDVISGDFFIDFPDLVLCGEMVGPDNPYVPKSFYDIESLEFFAFDIREKITGRPLPVMKRRELLAGYGIKSVRLFGEFEVSETHIKVEKIIRDFGKTLNEGVVIKDPDMQLSPIKYTSSQSNCADLRYAFEFYNDYGRDFFFPRVCREAFQSVEWDEDDTQRKERCHRLGESILLPMTRTIENRKKGERIGEIVQIRIKDLKTADDFQDHLRLLGIDAIFEEPISIGNEFIIKIKKINHSTSDKTDSVFKGEMWS
ncbi:MAG: RNA ligase [Candidatus Methanoperedens sp.]|nr:RNA ligase [Candidatus Methanoperedens sp.]MCE8428124.1 RNA ligase [Candidatus Methanoperedens sp.]